jgi:hypothetical protein
MVAVLVNTARSALFTGIKIDQKPYETHYLVIRLMICIFNLRPASPQTNITSDAELVLTFLKQLSPVKGISLKSFTLNLVILF